jgi:Uma2 family endonuclease
MVVQSALAEQRITLRNVDWETYERILASHEDSSAPRFVYDRGDLEIMSPFPEHEQTTSAIETVIVEAAEALDIDYLPLRSTTFKRADLMRGFEADCCFYLGHAPTIRHNEHIDLYRDPPPDLVVEIDISRSSVNKLGLFAEFGVPEVWRYQGHRLDFWVLAGDEYRASDRSVILPGVQSDEVSVLVERAMNERRRDWRRRVQSWAAALPR